MRASTTSPGSWVSGPVCLLLLVPVCLMVPTRASSPLPPFHAPDAAKLGSQLVLRHSDDSFGALEQLLAETKAEAVFFNHLYDPISLVRDNEVWIRTLAGIKRREPLARNDRQKCREGGLLCDPGTPVSCLLFARPLPPCSADQGDADGDGGALPLLQCRPLVRALGGPGRERGAIHRVCNVLGGHQEHARPRE